MKIIQIVGARPQFIKYFPVSRSIDKIKRTGKPVQNILVHTGQHYDHKMSQIFFDELGIPESALNLGVGSGSHGEQTAHMLVKIEEVLLAEAPDWVVVYGDTNSTLAGALAASKLHIPLAHVEAGLRSYNREMPEEINRVLTDHLSNLLLCPTATAVKNLAAEGVTTGVHDVGDVMYDALLHFSFLATRGSEILNYLGFRPQGYALLTLHRPSNTDTLESLTQIFAAISWLQESIFVFPAHPRTQKAIKSRGLVLPQNLLMIEPIGYLDMLALEKNAAIILTDSGGVQKEAYLLKVACVTLREETEWVETVEAGWNVLVGSNTDRIVQAVETFTPSSEWSPLFGDGHASDKIMRLLLS